MIHEDDRRILEDWPEAKTITAKAYCELGNHYHKIKTERFVLVKGEGTLIVEGKSFEMKIGELITILPFEMHAFKLKKDSVLIGLCSHVFDPNDDYK